jgi:hypothetical protein
MELFNRKGKAKKKWHSRAWLVDLNKTKLTLDSRVSPKHVWPWICEDLDPSVKDMFATSNVRKEYGLFVE